MIRGLRDRAVARSLGAHPDGFRRKLHREVAGRRRDDGPEHGPAALAAPQRGRGDVYTEKSLWETLDKDVVLASRIRAPTEIERFLRWVYTKADAGIPLCHAVMSGVLPEEAELGRLAGPHLRCIIGGNLRTRELLCIVGGPATNESACRFSMRGR